MPLRFPFSLALGLCLAASGASAAVALDGLTTDSPFVPKQAEGTAPVATEAATVEFRGLISTKEGILFGLYDRTRNTGSWVRQNDAGADFKVRAYDAANDMVTVEYQGQKLTLPLSTSKIGAAAPSPVMPVAVNAPVPGASPVAAVPGARPNDQQRLESVAAEVRRRRALRQAAASGASTPAPVQSSGAGK
ncbi:MAG TPA: hypothetical protein VIM44_07085 [Rariglobus sp.]